MNRRFHQAMSSVALTLGITMIPAEAILARDGSTGPEQPAGTWVITVTRIDPPPGLPPTFLGLLTMTPDGQVLAESNTTALRSLDYGEWVRTGPRRFHRSSVLFRFAPPPAPPRTYIGISRITADIRLDRSGNSFNGVSTTEQFDTEGNLTATLHGIEEGRRCNGSTSIKRCLGMEEAADQPSQR